jgi:hypothetical protein
MALEISNGGQGFRILNPYKGERCVETHGLCVSVSVGRNTIQIVGAVRESPGCESEKMRIYFLVYFRPLPCPSPVREGEVKRNKNYVRSN